MSATVTVTFTAASSLATKISRQSLTSSETGERKTWRYGRDGHGLLRHNGVEPAWRSSRPHCAGRNVDLGMELNGAEAGHRCR